MNQQIQTSVLYVQMECIERNWFCKQVKKLRSSQTSIPINFSNELSQTQFFPVSIINPQKFADDSWQFAIFNPLSYCFEETIGFDVKASFTTRPMSPLIKPGDITKEL